MSSEQRQFKTSLFLTIIFTSVLWIVWLCDNLFNLELSQYGIIPRNIIGLRGIILSPFIHDSHNIWHIASNTVPFMMLFFVLINAYRQLAFVVLISIHLLSGMLVWVLAPPYTSHIGISGIIYGIAAFLVSSGLFRRDMTSLAISFFIIVLYGGMVEGFLPQPGISWQSHLFGALVGIWLAFMLRNFNRHDTAAVQAPEEETEMHFFEEHP
jgi:membrane associated rhomboid family serine protease